MDIWYIFTLFSAFVVGAVMGSFSNVCIYRIPLQLSIIRPGSYCPTCKTPLTILDNIPLLSFVFLKRKCRHCQSNISWRYPAVELLTAIFYLLVYMRFDFHVAIIYTLLVTSLIIITFIDIDYKIIPNVITIPAIPIGLVLSYFFLPHSIISALIGMLGGGGLLLLMAVIYPGGMGGGDIKMVAMLGAFLGWQKVFLTIFLGSLIGSVVGIAMIISKKGGRKTKIPFGPYLAAGAILSIFFGNAIIEYYVNFTF
ncbi:MAG TPA: prepilin peptidase [Nitrospinota bacterium]|nr:prepilin peptidase [Nitrospinota bacterium]